MHRGSLAIVDYAGLDRSKISEHRLSFHILLVAMATVAAALSLPTSLRSSQRRASLSGHNGTLQWSQRRRIVCPKALEINQDTLLAIGVGLAGFAVGIGIPVFYETQVKGSQTRPNEQPCFPCSGTGSQSCRYCVGTGTISVELGGGEKEVSKCVNCDGAGNLTCTTCQGTGLQPRFLDRREFKDDDD